MLWVPGRLPGLNELVEARVGLGRVVGRGGKRWSGYSDMKKDAQERVVLCAGSQRFRALDGGHFSYLCVEDDKRRNPSNVGSGAAKIIEDALVKVKLLENDGWAQVSGETKYMHCAPDAEAGVFLVVQECPVISRQAMVERLIGYLEKGCRNV